MVRAYAALAVAALLALACSSGSGGVETAGYTGEPGMPLAGPPSQQQPPPPPPLCFPTMSLGSAGCTGPAADASDDAARDAAVDASELDAFANTDAAARDAIVDVEAGATPDAGDATDASAE